MCFNEEDGLLYWHFADHQLGQDLVFTDLAQRICFRALFDTAGRATKRCDCEELLARRIARRLLDSRHCTMCTYVCLVPGLPLGAHVSYFL